MEHKTKKHKAEYWDDGRVIAPMDGVQRMNPFAILPPSVARKRKEREDAALATARKYVEAGDSVPLSKKEQRTIRRAMMLAYLSVGLIIMGGFAAFLLLCQFVWFK